MFKTLSHLYYFNKECGLFHLFDEDIYNLIKSEIAQKMLNYNYNQLE